MRNSSSPRRSAGEWLLFGATRAALAVLIALTSYALLTYALARPLGADVTAYWNAAERLRAGETLYQAGAANASDLYRYAPWFAFAWIPLTYLPFEAVVAAWVGLMVAASLISTVPLLRLGPTGWAACAFFLPLQLQGAVWGNVQPLLVLMLMWGVGRRSGPVWIALDGTTMASALLASINVTSIDWPGVNRSSALAKVAFIWIDRRPMLISSIACSPIMWAPISSIWSAA